MSDLSGKKLQQITPENTQLVSWDLDKNTDSIFVRIKRDSDNDKTFSERDDMTVLRVNISKPGIGFEIINEQMHKEVSSILND
jgi:hypothetical protein